MQKIIKFQLIEIEPSKDAVLKANGYPLDKVPHNIHHLVDESFTLFRKTANPVGIHSNISNENFAEVLFGDGKNESDIPLQNIFPKAEHLTLFALTLGNKISNKIQELFQKNDFALGHMLDCTASLAANEAVRRLEEMSKTNQATLAYSPGYCGWHISGQKKLFEYLHPGKIGISLNESCLMTPIKSVSGILVSGAEEIHVYENDFEFCNLCSAKTCIERMNFEKHKET